MRIQFTAASALLAMLGLAHAQQQIEWKQTVNVAKGQNLSRERSDMLGIEFGDSYADAKAKLQKLDAEGIQPKPKAPTVCNDLTARYGGCNDGAPPSKLTEETKVFQIRMPRQSEIMTASYVGVMKLRRELPGGTPDRIIPETITIYLSAPSSGHQVIGMEREISYPQQDQPQISDIVRALRDKLKVEPHFRELGGNSVEYTFLFDNGQGVPPSGRQNPCGGYSAIRALANFEQTRAINSKGECDVTIVMISSRGISPNHSSIVRFAYSDNDRIKANGIGDYTYIQNYIASLQDRTRGAPPKL